MTKTTKIVYNDCFGGFGLSDLGMHRYAELKGLKLYPEKINSAFDITMYWTAPPEERKAAGILSDAEFKEAPLDDRRASNEASDRLSMTDRDIPRHDRDLVKVVEELGKAASGRHASLKIAEIPKGQRYRIDEYDGNENVMTIDDYKWFTA